MNKAIAFASIRKRCLLSKNTNKQLDHVSLQNTMDSGSDKKKEAWIYEEKSPPSIKTKKKTERNQNQTHSIDVPPIDLISTPKIKICT